MDHTTYQTPPPLNRVFKCQNWPYADFLKPHFQVWWWVKLFRKPSVRSKSYSSESRFVKLSEKCPFPKSTAESLVNKRLSLKCANFTKVCDYTSSPCNWKVVNNFNHPVLASICLFSESVKHHCNRHTSTQGHDNPPKSPFEHLERVKLENYS